jgi:hypothetical protein
MDSINNSIQPLDNLIDEFKDRLIRLRRDTQETYPLSRDCKGLIKQYDQDIEYMIGQMEFAATQMNVPNVTGGKRRLYKKTRKSRK